MMRRLQVLHPHDKRVNHSCVNHSWLMTDIATVRGLSIFIPLPPSLSFSLPLCATEMLHTNKAYKCLCLCVRVLMSRCCEYC